MECLEELFKMDPSLRVHFAFSQAESRMQGRRECMRDVALELLTARFGPLNDNIRTRVRSAEYDELEAIVNRLLTPLTLEQALGSLY